MGNRFVRDTFVLAAFCAGFYVLTVTINWFGSAADQKRAQEFSTERLQADHFYAKKDWTNAAVHFQKMTESDQFNGHAWFRLGDCYYKLRSPFVRALYREEYKPSPDPKRIEEIKTDAREFTANAAAAFKRAIDFPRYRNRSRFCLARMYAFDGEKDLSIQYLQNALDDGSIANVRGGINALYEFNSIREEPEFKKLVQQERVNSRRRYSRRGSN